MSYEPSRTEPDLISVLRPIQSTRRPTAGRPAPSTAGLRHTSTPASRRSTLSSTARIPVRDASAR